MANYYNCRFPVPEARRLASLYGIQQDLEAVLEYCALLSKMDVNSLDHTLWEAISAAAVVRYARCFSSGARVSLDHSLLDGAPPQIREAHAYMIAVRSKHVAHSVNEFEENDVAVTLREEGCEVSVQGVGAHHGRVVGLPFAGPSQLHDLSMWVQSAVKQQIAAEEPVLLALAHEYGPAAIKAFGVPVAGASAPPGAEKRTRSRP